MLSGWPEVLESMRKRYQANPVSLSQDPTLAEYVTGLSLFHLADTRLRRG